MSIRNRTHSSIIGYGLYLYFLGLSFRNAAKALSFLKITKISHVSIWNWLQKYRPWKYFKKRKIKEYVIDETMIKAGSELIWLWVVIESETNKNILGISISKERNTFVVVAERFLSNIIKEYGDSGFNRWRYLVSIAASMQQVLEDNSSSSYSSLEKSIIIERTIQY
jgi:putative transposase